MNAPPVQKSISQTDRGFTPKQVVVVGSGPAGLMAADVIAAAGHCVRVVEKRRNPGRKLLIAGSSGLNVTNGLPLGEFKSHYSGEIDCWSKAIERFPPAAWLHFINGLGHETFLGTSGRYFLREMKSGPFVRSWRRRLDQKGVTWMFGAECIGVEPLSDMRWNIKLEGDYKAANFACDAIVFALGGGSYEPEETPLRWPQIFQRFHVCFDEFRPSNVGYQISWPSAFIAECEGAPLKNIALTTAKGTRRGELVVTSYGIEGTPVYFVGETGPATLDLKPDLTVEQILIRCGAAKENLAPIRRVGKLLNLPKASHALLFHTAPREVLEDMALLAAFLKSVPLRLTGTQPLAEAISSAGGMALSEISENYMVKKMPGVFVAGEMLGWDAPTGGFLIQACVSQGFAAGNGVLDWVGKNAN